MLRRENGNDNFELLFGKRMGQIRALHGRHIVCDRKEAKMEGTRLFAQSTKLGDAAEKRTRMENLKPKFIHAKFTKSVGTSTH